MASVPLHCNICPKQPTFSDISHLLTHIGSKGHLSHYFKAQVRAPQNQSIREQLDTYEQWYKDHQIEKLLSQRMILKDSKKPNGTARNAKRERSASTKPSKPSKTTTQKHDPIKAPPPLPKADPNNVIDPQLSQLSAAPPQQVAAYKPSLPPSSPGLDLTSVYQAPMPRMRTFHKPSSTGPTTAELAGQLWATSGTLPATEVPRDGSDTENDDEAITSRGLLRPMYPELPSAEPLSATVEHEAIAEPSLPAIRRRPRRVGSNRDEELDTEEDFIPKTPELKGICYPGMSLFDSASPEAQRKRNQRKNESLIAQLEQETLEVECNEYIYWPDGALKMCRFITGDVQSSPLKEDTPPPPPPPPKRRRGRKPQGADTLPTKRKPRKGKLRQVLGEGQADSVKLETLPQTMEWPEDSPALIDTLPAGLGQSRAPPIEEEEDEWLLNMGEPVRGRRRLTPLSLDEHQSGDPFEHLANPLKSASGRRYMHVHADSLPAKEHVAYDHTAQAEIALGAAADRLILKPVDPNTAASARRSAFPAPPRGSSLEAEKENVLPGGRYAAQRTSHRYFMVNGDHEPLVTTSLPAEMAFAGMATPPVYRVSLNPLNPNAHLRRSLPYSSNYTAYQVPHLQTNSSDGARSMRQMAIIEERTNKEFDPESLMY